MTAALAAGGWHHGASLGGMYLAALPYLLAGVLVALAVCEAALLTQTWALASTARRTCSTAPRSSCLSCFSPSSS